MKKRIISLCLLLIILLSAGTALASVGYLGPAGTYTEEATVRYFGEDVGSTPVKTVQETLKLLKAGQFEYAVVPLENTIGGPVYPYLDAVIDDPGFAVIAEINLPIRQTLLAVPGTTLKDIKTILSHPQGIAQSRDWLKTHLPEAKLVEVSSTAEGVRKVAEAGDKAVAAIAAARTAKLYPVEILANDLQYTQNNVTRFWVVALRKNLKSDGEKSAFVVQGSVGKLPSLLAELSQAGFALVTIHDRAAKTLLGEYKFVLEVRGPKQAELLQQIISKHSTGLKIHYLGSYSSH